MTISYLNTDLELIAKDDLTPLLEALGDEVLILRHDRTDESDTAWLETAADCPDVESTLNECCRLLEGLPNHVQLLWDICHSRVANIGFASSLDPSDFNQQVQPETIQRLAALGIGITITIYPCQPDA